MSDNGVVNPFFHLGVIVDDIEAAVDELTRALHLTWSPIVDREVGEWHLRMAFSLDGPPFIELIEGVPGSPWDTSNGPRLDHIGLWSRDLDAERDRLAGDGFPIAIDGRDYGNRVAYHQVPAAGFRLEFLDAASREDFHRRWGLPEPTP